jgi:hypothetical protein
MKKRFRGTRCRKGWPMLGWMVVSPIIWIRCCYSLYADFWARLVFKLVGSVLAAQGGLNKTARIVLRWALPATRWLLLTCAAPAH